MKKRSIREWVVRAAILMVGLTIAHLGVTFFLLSDLGADSFNVLVQGVFRSLSGAAGSGILTHGRTHILVSILIWIILSFIDRSYIKIGTVLCMVCGGPIIDFFTWVLTPVTSSYQSIPGRVVMLCLGCVILAYGMTIVIKSDAGTGLNDLVSVVASDKLKTRFGITKLVVDAAFTLTGFLLGGKVGAGTLVSIALIGPVAEVFLPINEKLVNKALSRFKVG